MEIHYDGDQPLYTVENGATTLYIGTTGFITSGGLSVYDRDQTGQLVAIHTASAFSAWNIANPRRLYQVNIFGGGDTTWTEWAPGSGGQPTTQPEPFDSMNSGLNLARPDGFGLNESVVNPAQNAWSAVGELTFQGVRAYDDTTSQWASPDFYSGDVHDPASQRPFMWNGSNPLEYEDPSGYEGSCAGCQGMNAQHPPSCDESCGERLLVYAAMAIAFIADGGLPLNVAAAEEEESAAADTVVLYDSQAGKPSLGPGERLINQTSHEGWSPQQYWGQNAGELRGAIRAGAKIRDSAVDDKGDLVPARPSSFLAAERNLLGYTYNAKTRMWTKPKTQVKH